LSVGQAIGLDGLAASFWLAIGLLLALLLLLRCYVTLPVSIHISMAVAEDTETVRLTL
jgi:hypothetical protein